MGMKWFGLIALVLTVAACSQGHCRRKAEAPKSPVPAGADAPVPGNKPVNSDRVLVYKYDGSLQCGMGKAVSVEAMEKELKGITIYSAAKKPDGLMHIQVCGSITGMANVYEIPTSALKQAESRGFKKWSFE